MAIGLGVILIVVGAIIMWALNLDLEFVNDTTLGLILIVAGILTIVLSLVVNAQRSRHHTTHVEEQHHDHR
jgi:uncharacterized membrane protein HdeD (DUF308 family)